MRAAFNSSRAATDGWQPRLVSAANQGNTGGPGLRANWTRGADPNTPNASKPPEQQGGARNGATDDDSYNITESPVHVHDLNATLLHCLGIDHERLTFRQQGRDYRLTDVEGKVVKDLLA